MKQLILCFFLIITLSANGQTSPHWLQIQGKPFLDVRQYGAKPNDLTDDTAAIQAAVDAAGTSHVILITGGRYMINPIYEPLSRPDLPQFQYGGVRLASGQTMLFVGDGEFKNNRADGVNMGSLINIPFAENVTVINPFLTGNYTVADGHKPYSYTSGEQGMGICVNQSKNVKILGGLLRDHGGDGITFSNTFSAISGVALGGSSSERCLVDGVTITGCGRQGITVGGLKNSVLTNLNISDIWGVSPQSGVDFEPNPGTDKNINVSLTNSVITDADYGVLVFGEENDGITISGNTISNTTYSVALMGSSNITVSNNRLSPAGTATTTLAIPMASSVFAFGGANKGMNYVIDSNSIVMPTGANRAAVFTATALGSRTGSMSITNNNVFIGGDVLASVLIPMRTDAAHTGIFERNTFHIASGSAITSLSEFVSDGPTTIPASTTLFLRDRWTFNDNTFINNSATPLTPAYLLGTNAKLAAKPSNIYRGGPGTWVNDGSTAALQKVKNFKTVSYRTYTDAPGLASGASLDIKFNIAPEFISPFGTSPGPFWAVNVLGSKDAGGESYEFVGGVDSYDSTTGSTTVRIFRTMGSSTQRALVELRVSGYTLNSANYDQ